MTESDSRGPQFEEHPIHAELSTTIEALEAVRDKVEQHGLGEELQRRKVQLHAIGAHVLQVNANLFSDGDVDGVMQQVINAKGQLSNFQANSNVGHFNNAGKHIRSALSSLAPLVGFSSTHGVEVAPSIAELAEGLRSQVNGLTKKATSLGSKVDELANELEASKIRASEIQSANEASAQEWQKDRNHALETLETKIESLTTEYEHRVIAAVEAAESATKQVGEDLRELGEKDRVVAQSATNDLIEKIKQLQETAKDMVAKAAGDAMSASFAGKATERAKSALRWRGATMISWVAFALLAVGLLVLPVLKGVEYSSAGERLAEVAAHALTLGSFAAFAIYSGFQAKHFAELAARDAKTANVLDGIHSYLAPLEDKQRDRVLSEHFASIFRLHEEIQLEDDNPLVAKQAKRLAELRQSND